METRGLEFNNEKKNIELIRCIIEEGFLETNKNLEEWISGNNELAEQYIGSTAVIALYIGNQLFTANVGDSRAVLATLRKEKKLKSSKSKKKSKEFTLITERLSEDHKPGSRSEIKRIREVGGIVTPSSGSSSYRLTITNGPSLAVSRAFGDFHLRPGLIVNPTIHFHEIDLYDQFIVMGSDGIWDVLPDEKATQIVLELVFNLINEHSMPIQKACGLAADYLRDLAYALGSDDDLSVIVVPLNWNVLQSVNYFFDAPVHNLKEKKRKKNSAPKLRVTHN